MRINTELIQSLNPCRNRLENWLKHYKSFNGTLHEFLSLEQISAEDKVWVAVRVLDRKTLEVFAIDCAFAANANAAAAANTADVSAAYAAANTADVSAAYAADAAAAHAAAWAADAADAAAAHAARAAAYATYTADAAANAAAYTTYTADAAANAAAWANDVDNEAAYYAERERQVDALIYLTSKSAA